MIDRKGRIERLHTSRLGESGGSGQRNSELLSGAGAADHVRLYHFDITIPWGYLRGRHFEVWFWESERLECLWKV